MIPIADRSKRRGERDDKRILLTLVIGMKPNGKPERKYFYGYTREEAARKREEYKRAREKGIPDFAETITVSEWIDMWYIRYKRGITPSSAKNYHALITRLKSRIGGKLLRTIVESDLQLALYDVEELSKSTIEKYYSLIRQVFSKATRNRLLPFDPSEDLRIPEGTEGSHRALLKWESNFILAHWQDHRSGLWAMLMLLLGIRRGEMIALDWSDIDLQHNQVFIHRTAVLTGNKTVICDRTKTVAGVRVLPICRPLLEALESVPQEQRVGPVCQSIGGKRLTESAFNRGWSGFNLAMTRILNGEPVCQQGRRRDLEKEVQAEQRVFSVRAHDLRHTFATAMYDAGISIKAAQYYLGHADMRMTMELYTHLSEEREHRERSELTTFLDAWLNISEAGVLAIPESSV